MHQSLEKRSLRQNLDEASERRDYHIKEMFTTIAFYEIILEASYLLGYYADSVSDNTSLPDEYSHTRLMLIFSVPLLYIVAENALIHIGSAVFWQRRASMLSDQLSSKVAAMLEE